jgi:hypothetical protein
VQQFLTQLQPLPLPPAKLSQYCTQAANQMAGLTSEAVFDSSVLAILAVVSSASGAGWSHFRFDDMVSVWVLGVLTVV